LICLSYGQGCVWPTESPVRRRQEIPATRRANRTLIEDADEKQCDGRKRRQDCQPEKIGGGKRKDTAIDAHDRYVAGDACDDEDTEANRRRDQPDAHDGEHEDAEPDTDLVLRNAEVEGCYDWKEIALNGGSSAASLLAFMFPTIRKSDAEARRMFKD